MKAERIITPVILAGGQGKRLWPIAGEKSPKPFLKLCSKRTLLQDTLKRVEELAPPIILTHQDYLPYVHENLSEMGVVPRAIILEPEHKGTAAAIAQAAFFLKNKNETMLVMPSDHVHKTDQSLVRMIDSLRATAEGGIVMLGAKPTRSEIGYGYVKYEKDQDNAGTYKVKSFVEKPDIRAARNLLADGACFWNTGMFMACPEIFLDELVAHNAQIYKTCERAFYAGHVAGLVHMPNADIFAKVPTMSVDYAVMEHCANARIAELPGIWSDIGTWPRVIRVKMAHLFFNRYLQDNKKPVSKDEESYKKVS